jgi:protoheme IX farnesyltransferase
MVMVCGQCELAFLQTCITYPPVKATVQTLPAGILAERSRAAVFADLIKARLTTLVLLTTLAGFCLGARGAMDFALMVQALIGTALLASGAAALNQLMERRQDALMRRTSSRPLPAGHLQPETVLAFGAACSVGGLLWLAFAVNPLTALIGAITLFCYLFVYTPLKRVTWMNTLVGAVPGALPPVMGWTAARGELSAEGWALFGIVALWQLPHFFAIAWLYRDDYARAGFKMLPSVDPDGRRTAHQSVAYTLALLVVSVCPFALKLAGLVYLGSALVLGGGFAVCAVQFAQTLSDARARVLFFASIVYLPLLLAVLTLDKVK